MRNILYEIIIIFNTYISYLGINVQYDKNYCSLFFFRFMYKYINKIETARNAGEGFNILFEKLSFGEYQQQHKCLI